MRVYVRRVSVGRRAAGLPSHRRTWADSNGTMFIGCMAAGSQAARHSLLSAGWGLKVQPHPHESEPHVSRAIRGKCWGDFFHRSTGGYIMPTCRDLLPGRLRWRARARGRAEWLGGVRALVGWWGCVASRHVLLPGWSWCSYWVASAARELVCLSGPRERGPACAFVRGGSSHLG